MFLLLFSNNFIPSPKSSGWTTKYVSSIKFFSKNFSNNLIINAYDKYTINLPDQSLKDAVNNFGNEDNKTQAKNKFQIFLVGYRNNKIVYHIASSFFKIYWQH